MIDNDAAKGAGHAMLAIGDDENGWQVFSFERANQDGGTRYVEGDAVLSEVFEGTLQELLDQGSVEGIYFNLDEAIVAETSADVDAAAIGLATGLDAAAGTYDLLNRNCLQVAVGEVANAAGNMAGSGDVFKNGTVPKITFAANKKNGSHAVPTATRQKYEQLTQIHLADIERQ